MVLRWSVAAVCCGLLVMGGAGATVRAADDKPAAEKKAAETKTAEDAGKGGAEKDAKADSGKNGKKNGNGQHAAAMVQTRPTARGEQGHVKVLVPVPDAKLWVDDMLTRATGLERSFLSPVRDRDRTYSYQLRAEWTDAEGHTVKKKVRAAFHGQEDVIVDFR